MASDVENLEKLESEIRKIIDANKKFLDRVMDDEFEPEDDVSDTDEPVIEEL